MINVAVIGCGVVAQRHHVPAFARHPEVHIVACCDVDQQRSASLAAAYKVSSYTSVERMLDEQEIDIVDIVTRETDRPPLLLACLRAGKHIFSEKPLAGAEGQYRIQFSDLPVLHEIIDEWQRQGTKFGINFNLRQSMNVRHFKAAVDSGELGEPVIVSGDTHIGSTNHVLDLMRWVNGDVAEVSAVSIGTRSDPSRCVHLTFENGSIGTFMNTPETDLYFRVQYFGARERAVCNNICGSFERLSRDGERVQRWHPSTTSDQTYPRIFAQSVEGFITSVLEDGTPPATGLDGLRQAEIDAAITESMQTGRRVRVERYPVAL